MHLECLVLTLWHNTSLSPQHALDPAPAPAPPLEGPSTPHVSTSDPTPTGPTGAELQLADVLPARLLGSAFVDLTPLQYGMSCVEGAAAESPYPSPWL